MLKGSFFKHQLIFRFSAGTSRGVLREKDTWFLRLWDDKEPDVTGIGECGPLAGLSPDPTEEIENSIAMLIQDLENMDIPRNHGDALKLAGAMSENKFPSLRFALETALLDLLNGGKRMVLDGGFFSGQLSIPINGLIWMNEKDHMLKQAEDKISQGFTCIKMKIGAINFDEELEVLEHIRKIHDPNLVLRVDANGAFNERDVIQKLHRLSEFNLHSIEQPVKPGNLDFMAEICWESPVPIALDEELIGQGINKEKLLSQIKPQYIVLKPTLIGGLAETEDWIRAAEMLDINWWITSMLESNIGLNAIAQFAADKAPDKIHGLGTGQLYSNNIGSPLTIQNGHISYLNSKSWDYSLFHPK